MRTKKSQSLIRSGLLLAVLILINYVSVRLFDRIDLTEQKIFTLSDASKKLVGSLTDRVNVKLYFTEDLPSPYNNNRRHVLDMLNEYKAFSNGNLHYEFYDPGTEENEKEARKNGIPPVEVQVVHDDKLEVKRAYLGLVMFYEDKKEVIPIIQKLSTLEYDFSSAFKRLTQKEKKRIGFTTGQGEAQINQLQAASQAISQQYDFGPVDITKLHDIQQDISSLVILDPKSTFSDTAKMNIDQFLMRGGKLAFLGGKGKIDMTFQSKVGQLVDFGLDTLFENYGFRIDKNLVKDAQCATIGVVQQQGPYSFQSQVQFPFIPRITTFNDKNLIVKDLQELIFPFPSSIDTSLAQSAGIKTEVLFYTSDMAAKSTDKILMDPFHKYSKEEFNEKHVPLAVIFRGNFKSYYSGKIPEAKIAKSPETLILVAGAGAFMDDNFAQAQDNITLFSNIIDFLADDSGLITIRSKNIVMPPLEQLSDSTKKMLKYGLMILPPVFVIIFGLLRWRRKNFIKRAMQMQV